MRVTHHADSAHYGPHHRGVFVSADPADVDDEVVGENRHGALDGAGNGMGSGASGHGDNHDAHGEQDGRTHGERAVDTQDSAHDATDGMDGIGATEEPDTSATDGATSGELLADALAEARGGAYALRPSARALLALCARYIPLGGLEVIYDAYQVASLAHEGVKRKTGEPYIEHPIAVATLLAELALDSEGVAAALLHDTVEDTPLTLDDVRAQFGENIATIVDGVTKFTVVEAPTPSSRDQLPPHSAVILPPATDRTPAPPATTPAAQTAHAATSTNHVGAHANGAMPTLLTQAEAQAKRERKARQQVETFNKLFVMMLQDPRVVLLKLADRLHNLRTMDAMSPAQREVKSRETLDVFAPLAGRIGLYLYKIELEDLAFSYLEPAAYERMRARLQGEQRRRAGWAQRMCERMERELAARGILAAVNWRMKRPYSAYRDTQQNGMDVGLLADVIAFRVIVPTASQCYQAMGIIHHLWPHYPDAFHDYVAAPKVNGYQSLHTAVFALDGRLAQLHIRTHAMHRASQHGVALRWLESAAMGDAEVGQSALAVKRANSWVRQIGAWRNEMTLSAKEFVDTFKGEMLEDQVFVFTPKGDVLELPAGSTVLDLAYKIHTRLGDHTTGARVVSNDENGLLVGRDVPISYILRNGDVVRAQTSPDARPLPGWLDIVRTRYATEKIARSLRLLERAGELGQARAYAYQSEPDDLRGEPSAESEPEPPTPLTHPSGRIAEPHLARCCCPVPGDRIGGVVERGRRVAVHRLCCRTMRATLARRAARSAPHAQVQPVTWDEIQPITCLLRLEIYGHDHLGLMNEVSAVVAQMGLPIARSVASSNQYRNKADIVMTVAIPPTMRRETLMRRLRATPGVTQVNRETRKGCVREGE